MFSHQAGQASAPYRRAALQHHHFRGPVADRSEVIWVGKHAAPPGNTTRVRGVARLGGADWTSGSRFPLALKRLRRSAASHTRRPCICLETTEESVEAASRLGCAGAQGVGGRVGGAMGAAGVATVHGGAAETRGPCGLWPGQEWKAPACAMAGLGLGPPPPPRALAGPLVWRGPRDSRGPSATSAGHAGSSQRARALPARGRHMLKCGLVCQGRLGPSGAPALLGDPTLQAYTRGS